MRVLLDTNVVLDVLLEREPHAHAAAQLLSLVDAGHLEGYLCATTITTVHYLAAKALGARRAASLIATLLDVFAIAPVDREVVAGALGLGFADFEDAVIHEAAVLAEATAIVTRNGQDFRGSRIPVFDPSEMLAAVYASEAIDPCSVVSETHVVALRGPTSVGEARGFMSGMANDFDRDDERF